MRAWSAESAERIHRVLRGIQIDACESQGLNQFMNWTRDTVAISREVKGLKRFPFSQKKRVPNCKH